MPDQATSRERNINIELYDKLSRIVVNTKLLSEIGAKCTVIGHAYALFSEIEKNLKDAEKTLDNALEADLDHEKPHILDDRGAGHDN